MSRSVKKGPYVDEKVLKKVQKQKGSGEKAEGQLFLTCDRLRPISARKRPKCKNVVRAIRGGE